MSGERSESVPLICYALFYFMRDSEFQKLINKTIKAGREHHGLLQEVTQEMQRRYGIDHNEADMDWLIDVLDYCNGGGVTVAEIKSALENAVPRN
jgi:hypothetical protein